MLILDPESAHDYWRQVDGPYRSRRAPQEYWDARPNSPAAAAEILLEKFILK